MSACLFCDAAVSRVFVVCLFAIFFAVLTALSVRRRQFDCGCFGSSGGLEGRGMILFRGLAALILAIVYAAAPTSGPLPLLERVWIQAAGWSFVAMSVAVAHSREFSSVQFEERV